MPVNSSFSASASPTSVAADDPPSPEFLCGGAIVSANTWSNTCSTLCFHLLLVKRKSGTEIVLDRSDWDADRMGFVHVELPSASVSCWSAMLTVASDSRDWLRCFVAVWAAATQVVILLHLKLGKVRARIIRIN